MHGMLEGQAQRVVRCVPCRHGRVLFPNALWLSFVRVGSPWCLFLLSRSRQAAFWRVQDPGEAEREHFMRAHEMMLRQSTRALSDCLSVGLCLVSQSSSLPARSRRSLPHRSSAFTSQQLLLPVFFD
jgi:hypothetical protein